MAVLGVFVLAPTALGLALSLTDWDGSSAPRFVGFSNFVALVSDSRFGSALRNTLVFAAVTVPAQVVLGFLLAAAVHAPWFVGRGVVRAMLFIPTVVSIIAVGFIWRWMLEPRTGLVPLAFASAGLESPDFLQGGAAVSMPLVGEVVSWPMVSVCVVQIWKMAGFCMVLYLAALQQVPESLGEAARIDGASRWQTLRSVTWPAVAPTTTFLLVTGLIAALQVFDLVWALSAMSDNASTRVLGTLLFREFQQSRLGFAAAVGVVVFALTLALIAAESWRARRAAT